jgi:hypothetical protein
MRLVTTQSVGGAELVNPGLDLALQCLKPGELIHPTGQLLKVSDDQCAHRGVTLRGDDPGIAVDIIRNRNRNVLHSFTVARFLCVGIRRRWCRSVRGSASRLDRGRGVSQLIRGTSGNDYIGPRLSQGDGRGRTDTPSGTGDHRDPAVKAEPIEHTHTAKITPLAPSASPDTAFALGPAGKVVWCELAQPP